MHEILGSLLYNLINNFRERTTYQFRYGNRPSFFFFSRELFAFVQRKIFFSCWQTRQTRQEDNKWKEFIWNRKEKFEENTNDGLLIHPIKEIISMLEKLRGNSNSPIRIPRIHVTASWKLKQLFARALASAVQRSHHRRWHERIIETGNEENWSGDFLNFIYRRKLDEKVGQRSVHKASWRLTLFLWQMSGIYLT